jgi:ferredoxin
MSSIDCNSSPSGCITGAIVNWFQKTNSGLDTCHTDLQRALVYCICPLLKDLLVDPEKCIQCHGCEIAFKTWRDLDYGVQYRRVLNIWQGEYPRVKNAFLSMACLHCVEPAFVSACPEEAITSPKTKSAIIWQHY